MDLDDFPELGAAPQARPSQPSQPVVIRGSGSAMSVTAPRAKPQDHESDGEVYPLDIGNGVLIHDGTTSPYKHLVVHSKRVLILCDLNCLS